MRNNQLFSESVTENNEPRKWCHPRWVKIICICLIFLTIFAIALSLVLKLVVLAPKKPKTTTITVTPSAMTTVISTIPLPTTTAQLTTPEPLLTSTAELTTTTTTAAAEPLLTSTAQLTATMITTQPPDCSKTLCCTYGYPTPCLLHGFACYCDNRPGDTNQGTFYCAGCPARGPADYWDNGTCYYNGYYYIDGC